MSVDPLQFKYPYYTPFQYAGNKPISFIDLDGAEEFRKPNGELIYTQSQNGVSYIVNEEYEKTVKSIRFSNSISINSKGSCYENAHE